MPFGIRRAECAPIAYAIRRARDTFIRTSQHFNAPQKQSHELIPFLAEYKREKMADIVPSELFAELKQEVELLRTELSMVVLERDDLVFKQCKNIEMHYWLVFADLIYKYQTAENNYLRLKRKFEMIQAHINRQEKINITKIENHLNIEMREYDLKAEKAIEEMKRAVERNSRMVTLSEDTDKTVKKLYRKVVRLLHPDLHPDQPEQHKLLFESAVKYYETANIEGLEMITKMVENGEETFLSGNEDAIERLKNEKAQLLTMIKKVQAEIIKIKQEVPYKLIVFLEDEQKQEAKKEEFREAIRQYQEYASVLQYRIDKLMENNEP